MTPQEPTTANAEPWSHHEAIVNSVRLHYVAAGPAEGDLVVLLHGFPEFWYSWHEQLPALAEAGYRVVAPDMRGYNRSEKPPGVASYDTMELVGDVAGLIEHLGYESAHVVGHDWGGAVAWATAIGRPDVVDRLVILNAPHPTIFERELRSNPDQLRKSWYVFAFQVPWLPEFLLSVGDAAAIGRLFENAGADGDAFSPEEVEHYREVFADRGTARAAVNYYRATVRDSIRDLPGEGIGDLPVHVPTLVLWGEQDVALSMDLLDGLDGLVEDLEVRTFPDASHWLQADEPEAVTEGLLAFFADGTAGDVGRDRSVEGE